MKDLDRALVPVLVVLTYQQSNVATDLPYNITSRSNCVIIIIASLSEESARDNITHDVDAHDIWDTDILKVTKFRLQNVCHFLVHTTKRKLQGVKRNQTEVRSAKTRIRRSTINLFTD